MLSFPLYNSTSTDVARYGVIYCVHNLLSLFYRENLGRNVGMFLPLANQENLTA